MGGLTKVTLVSDALGEQKYGIQHAQRILDYEKTKGFKNWQLSPGKGFELQDGIIKRANKRADKSTKERAETSEGDTARAEA